MSEPAFPYKYRSEDSRGPYQLHETLPGLSKRELLAAMAMQGIVSNPHTAHLPSAGVASCATTLADALLKALEVRSE